MASKKSKYHQHFAHDQGLIHTLILTWLTVLLVGSALHKGQELLPDHITSLFPSFSVSHLTASKDSDPSWKHVEFHGDIELFRRPIALVLEEYSPYFSTRATGLYAYRAVTSVDLPIEALLHVFRDAPNNVSKLVIGLFVLYLEAHALFCGHDYFQVDWVKDLKVSYCTKN